MGLSGVEQATVYSPSEALTSNRQNKISASSLTVHECFHCTTTPANVLLEVIEDAVKGLLNMKTKHFEDINTTVFKTISFIGKRCAVLRGYQPGSDIRTEAEPRYGIVDPILDGMVDLFDYEVSE